MAMRTIYITPRLLLLLLAGYTVQGILLSAATTAEDQYPLVYSRGEGRGVPRMNEDDDDEVLVIPGKWWTTSSSKGFASESQDGPYEIILASANASGDTAKDITTNELVAYEIEQAVPQSRLSIAQVKKRGEGERQQQKKTKKKEEEEDDEEEENNPISLKELLRQWGVDTSARVQRGDIEVTEAPRDDTGRGDVPVAALFGQLPRSKRQASGRKLLWKTAMSDKDAWGYGDDGGDDDDDGDDGDDDEDGYQGDQAPRYNIEDEDAGREEEEEKQRRLLAKGAAQLHHRGSNHRNDGNSGGDGDVDEDEENKHEMRRIAEEEEKARRRQWEQEQMRRRQHLREEEEEERRRAAATATRPDTSNNHQHQHQQQQQHHHHHQHQDRPGAVAETPEQSTSYEERLRQWQQMKEEYDKLVREKQSGRYRNRTKTPEELENERKLQDYIRRNTPIDVSGRRGPMTSRPDDRSRPDVGPNPSVASVRANSEYEERRRAEAEERHRRLEQQQQLEKEKLRRERPPRPEAPVTTTMTTTTTRIDDDAEEERQRLRENEAIRQAEHRRRLEEEQRRRLIEERSRRYEEEQRKAYELQQSRATTATAAPASHHHQPPQHHQQQDLTVKTRPYPQPVKTGGREDERRGEFATVDRSRDPSSRKRPWTTERPTTTTSAVETAETEREKGEEEHRETTGYPDRRRPEQRGWHEEENRRRYLELKKHSDTVYRHGRPPFTLTISSNTPTSVTGAPAPPPPSPAAVPVLPRRNEVRDEDSHDNENEEKEPLRRLESAPVASKIMTTQPLAGSNNDTTKKQYRPKVTSRLGGGINYPDGIDFPGFSPHRRGPEATHFPAPVTPRAPVKSPKPCVWAIVVCCRNTNNIERQSRCFEATDCPSWDSERCIDNNIRAANREIMNFYLKSRANFL